MLDQIKPRDPAVIFAEKQQRARDAQRDRRRRLIAFVEGRMMAQDYQAHGRPGFAIPTADFDTEFGTSHYRVVDYVSEIYLGTGWQVDDGLTEEGRPFIRFTAHPQVEGHHGPNALARS